MRAKQLEEQNRWLKQVVADLTLDKGMPQDVALLGRLVQARGAPSAP